MIKLPPLPEKYHFQEEGNSNGFRRERVSLAQLRPPPMTKDICIPQNILSWIKNSEGEENKLLVIKEVLDKCTTKKARKGSGGKKMNAWICYNKTCVVETGMNYMECVRDKKRSQEVYYPNKEQWRRDALEGCPRAQATPSITPRTVERVYEEDVYPEEETEEESFGRMGDIEL